MRPSVSYPDPPDLNIAGYPGFCEQRFEDALDPILTDTQREARRLYGACIAGVPDFVRRRYLIPAVVDVPEIPGCRLIHPAVCDVGLHRVGSNTCRAVQRRSWTCPNDYFKGNRFNSCYLIPEAPPGDNHPACGPGSPTLVAQDCSTYVGGDYARNASTIDCARDFPTADPPDPDTELKRNTQTGTSADNWCSFDARLLKVVCHSTNPPVQDCAPDPALCLKRASETGGCNAIAHTITCRALQADYADPQISVSVDDIQGEGCEPCAILPFTSVSNDCPQDIVAAPTPVQGTDQRLHEAVHRVKADFYHSSQPCLSIAATGDEDLAGNDECKAQPVCFDPPRGRVAWRSNHFSQVAVVNSPITLNIREVPIRYRRTPTYEHNWRWARDPLRRSSFRYLEYPDEGHGDPTIHMFFYDYSGARHSSVSGMVERGECRLDRLPYFRVVIEELWPDRTVQRQEIERLFPEGTLDTWDDLDTVQKRRWTEARGMRLWSDLTSAQDQADELQEREENLIETVDCNYGRDIWCRWLPKRPGYYRLKGAGSWSIRVFTSQNFATRSWVDANLNPFWYENLLDELQDPAYRADLAADLANIGLTPADLGLNSSLTGLLPLGTQEGLFTEEYGATARCPAIDIRVVCSASSRTANYTETEYIGIAVHEMRVATRAPNL